MQIEIGMPHILSHSYYACSGQCMREGRCGRVCGRAQFRLLLDRLARLCLFSFPLPRPAEQCVQCCSEAGSTVATQFARTAVISKRAMNVRSHSADFYQAQHSSKRHLLEHVGLPGGVSVLLSEGAEEG